MATATTPAATNGTKVATPEPERLKTEPVVGLVELAKSADKVLRVPLTDILVRYDWNVRGGDYKTVSEGPLKEEDEGSQGLKSLIESIRTEGQRTPVDIRPNTSKSRHPYELVTGFRRVTALMRISEQDGKNVDVRAVLHDKMTEGDAKLLNVTENTVRDDLDVCDLVYAVGELERIRGEDGKQVFTQTQIAQRIGRVQGYVSTLVKISRGLQPQLMQRWRSEYRDHKYLTVANLFTICTLEPAQQIEKFNSYVAQSKSDPAGDWYGSAKASAEKLGALLALIEYTSGESLGIAEVSEELFPNLVKARVGMTWRKKEKAPLTARELKNLSKAVADSFASTLETAREKASGPDGEEEAEA